jgi:hypothetical protein
VLPKAISNLPIISVRETNTVSEYVLLKQEERGGEREKKRGGGMTEKERGRDEREREREERKSSSKTSEL